jgi:tetrahydromethanopterin S-methyltransferase subunit A
MQSLAMVNTLPQMIKIEAELRHAIEAKKCWRCGCFHDTVNTLRNSAVVNDSLGTLLSSAQGLFEPKRYDCLGCEVCWPAVAQNLAAELDPAIAEGSHCATEQPELREGWPPLPGEYTVIRYGAPVAVCTLNDEELSQALADHRPDGLAIVGTMHTENLGIERIIRNALGNPNIRFLLLCGEDTQRAVGHLPGQSFESLFQNGLDEHGRIIDAKGKRPWLKNVSKDEVRAFIEQVEPVSMIGESSADAIITMIGACAQRNPGPNPNPYHCQAIERIQVTEPPRLSLDKAGYFVIYPDARTMRLIVEHYTNKGVLNCVLEGNSTGALYAEAIQRELVTRLDHAAYLGRELARAETSLLDGTPFVQDAAPGEPDSTEHDHSVNENCQCGCSSSTSIKGSC